MTTRRASCCCGHLRATYAGDPVPDCGTTVCWTSDALPDFVAIAAGAFADPELPAPALSVYEARRHAWTTMPALEGIERRE